MTRSSASYESEIRYWREMALIYHQQIQAAKRTPERHYGRTALHRDPTGNAAVNAVEKERKRKN
ncbi:hypothetical protein [Arthrobacter sp. StoSoilB20]|uniref:hypothetical protein n=1 Tax=Arthrobacter sp. StoSoilB20 TaxID=2830995 RepID=UPI001CC4C9B5|nr:hypothetical protein [Arthrobacter sp. StoSoilB20]